VVDKADIIVLGNGFLGKKFAMRGYEVWGRNRFNLLPDYPDLTVLGGYDVVVNCIAKSNTRWCECRENFQSALWSNGNVPGLLSNYCKTHGIRFVHVSTGCLYDSGTGNNMETDFLAAHCNYTVTKWVGEMNLVDDDLVVRPRLLFGDHDDRNNILSKLGKFAKYTVEKDSLTSTDVLVDAIEALIRHHQTGVFNVACDGTASMAEISEWIGLTGGYMTEEELHEAQHLFLVNNTMNLDKLKQCYKPPLLRDEVLRCWRTLNA